MENLKLRMTRKQLGTHLRGRGFPISDSVLDKLCAPTVNEGPPVSCWWGRRPLYDPDEGVAWAEARTRPAQTDAASCMNRAGGSTVERPRLSSSAERELPVRRRLAPSSPRVEMSDVSSQEAPPKRGPPTKNSSTRDYDGYDAQDDINKSVAEGFTAIRERKAAGGPGCGEPTDYPEMPEFLVRKPNVADDGGRR